MKKKIYLFLVVLSLFIVTGCNKKEEDKGTKLVENEDYYIRGEFTGKYLDIKKRGYYIDTLNEPNAPYFYIIYMGERSTGGFDLEIDEVKKVDDQTIVIVKEISPKKGDTVTQVLTSPTIVLEFPKSQKNIVIQNTDGEVFNRLN